MSARPTFVAHKHSTLGPHHTHFFSAAASTNNSVYFFLTFAGRGCLVPPGLVLQSLMTMKLLLLLLIPSCLQKKIILICKNRSIWLGKCNFIVSGLRLNNNLGQYCFGDITKANSMCTVLTNQVDSTRTQVTFGIMFLNSNCNVRAISCHSRSVWETVICKHLAATGATDDKV